MRENFEPVPETFYPVSLGGRILSLPVSRSDTTGRLIARDAENDTVYHVEDETRLVRLPVAGVGNAPA